MKFHIVTLFPEMCRASLAQGVLSGAIERGLLDVAFINPRDFTVDRHRVVDDAPYGGFPGMVLKPEPIAKAIESTFPAQGPKPRVILMSPQGRLFDHESARRLAGESALVLVAGRYKGVDERVREILVDEELSIGDYVLTGGELAALVVVDAVARFLPDVLGDPDSARTDSFFEGLLDAGYFTRPEVFRDRRVPGVLLSGHHEEVRRWRRREALRRTWLRRPELLDHARLSDEDRRLLEDIQKEGR